MPPLGDQVLAPEASVLLFRKDDSVKKLFALFLSAAFAATLGMGAIGCSKKTEEKKKVETTTETKDGKTTETKKVESETKNEKK